MTISDALAAYRICAKAESKSQKTIRHITQSVGQFAEFMGADSNLESLTANDLRRFIIGLQEKHKYAHHPFHKPTRDRLSPHSIATYVRGVKVFFAFLEREELLEQNPMKKVKVPKVPANIVPTFTERQVEKLLAQPDRSTSTGYRDYALMTTIVDTAARLSEIATLKVQDVDLENGYLRVTGKGNKERFIPFGQRVAKILLKYKLKYRQCSPPDECFWITKEGSPLTADRIQKIVSNYGEKAGLLRCYPHKLRHTSSVLYLRNGGDPFSLQKKLGHSSLQMTRHYSNLADSDVRARQLRYGVVDRLKL